MAASLFLAFPDVYRPHRIGIQKGVNGGEVRTIQATCACFIYGKIGSAHATAEAEAFFGKVCVEQGGAKLDIAGRTRR